MVNTYKRINIASPSAGGGGSSPQVDQVFLQSQGNTNIIGLVFDSTTLSGVKIDLLVEIDATTDIKEYFTITTVFDNGSWDIQIESVGGTSATTFSINSTTGQISYSSSTYVGFVQGNISHRYDSLTTSL